MLLWEKAEAGRLNVRFAALGPDTPAEAPLPGNWRQFALPELVDTRFVDWLEETLFWKSCSIELGEDTADISGA